MEIACAIDCRLAAPERPGRSGGLRPGRKALADPVAAAELTEAMARALEGIGAAVETERAREAFFAVGGLRGLYGGEVGGAAKRAGQGDAGTVTMDYRRLGQAGLKVSEICLGTMTFRPAWPRRR